MPKRIRKPPAPETVIQRHMAEDGEGEFNFGRAMSWAEYRRSAWPSAARSLAGQGAHYNSARQGRIIELSCERPALGGRRASTRSCAKLSRSATPLNAADIAAAPTPHGLILRGGFAFGPGEDRTRRAVGQTGEIGAAGRTSGRRAVAAFPALAGEAASRAREPAGHVGARGDRRGGGTIRRACRVAVRPAVSAVPAMGDAGGRLKPSPLGILMQPEYGLWHAYRGALLFDVELDLSAPREAIHLCGLCAGKPCLKSCPVDAYDGRFRVRGVPDPRARPNGAPCRDGGCLDRNACPYGTAYRYPADEQAFHMAAFADKGSRWRGRAPACGNFRSQPIGGSFRHPQGGCHEARRRNPDLRRKRQR